MIMSKAPGSSLLFIANQQDLRDQCFVQIYSWLGVEPPRGVLLHGPPGCGKTALANAIANECDVPFLRISAPEIVSGMSGMSLPIPRHTVTFSAS